VLKRIKEIKQQQTATNSNKPHDAPPAPRQEASGASLTI
jgi:hypothetical protein